MSEPCGHNSYWTTAYQNCVLCENAALRVRIAALEQDQRVRIEALHTLRTGYDATVAQLEAQLATLTAERDQARARIADLEQDERVRIEALHTLRIRCDP